MYRDLQVSLMRFCNDLKSNFGATIPEFINFDAAWDESQLPDSPVLGYMGLTFEVDDQFVEGSFQIGFTTKNDENLFLLSESINKILLRLLPTSKLKIYDATTGSEKGFMVVRNGTRVMPVAGSKTRPIQFVAVQFATTTTFKLPGDIQQFL